MDSPLAVIVLSIRFLTFIVSVVAFPNSSEYHYYKNNIKHPKETEYQPFYKYGSSHDFIKVFGSADINVLRTGTFEIISNLNITTDKVFECPSLDGASSLTQEKFINILTAPCRYDRFKRPISHLGSQHPVEVTARSLIYELRYETKSAPDFQIRGLMQLRYTDPRLAYGNSVHFEHQNYLLEKDLENKIWLPKIKIVNQLGLNLLEPNDKQRISLLSDGSVIISYKFASYNCWEEKEGFPFIIKQCSVYLKSYIYNTSQLLLSWEQTSPLRIDPQFKPINYVLTNTWSNESAEKDFYEIGYGFYSGNYSSLSFTITLTKEIDLYLMDYFFPSMMIVAISWVSFWLQADQTPARTTLGTSTLLSFITLSSAQSKRLPKIKSISISEIWFLGCTFFIFGSLVEFAFVNNIWRRHKNVQVKKINSKYVFKSTFLPNNNKNPVGGYRLVAYKRKNIFKPEDSSIIYVTNEDTSNQDLELCKKWKKKTVDQKFQSEITDFSKMTPHEISLWIDKKARFIFPLTFVIFNGIFWTFLYCM